MFNARQLSARNPRARHGRLVRRHQLLNSIRRLPVELRERILYHNNFQRSRRNPARQGWTQRRHGGRAYARMRQLRVAQ